MLKLITGHTGSGKSYFAIKLLLEEFKKDRVILTNIEINIEAKNLIFENDEKILSIFLEFAKIMEENPNQEQAKEQLRTHKYANVLFVIDEAHFCGFRKKNESLNNFLTIHRHMGVDIILITQTPTNIWRNHLELIHIHYQCLPSSSRILPNMSKIRIYEPYGSRDYNTFHQKFNPEIFELYKAGKKETSINKDLIKLILIFVVLIFVVLFAFSGFSDYLRPPVSPGSEDNSTKIIKKTNKDKNHIFFSSGFDKNKEKKDMICDKWKMIDVYIKDDIDIANSRIYVLKAKDGGKFHYVKSICLHKVEYKELESFKSAKPERGLSVGIADLNDSSNIFSR